MSHVGWTNGEGADARPPSLAIPHRRPPPSADPAGGQQPPLHCLCSLSSPVLAAVVVADMTIILLLAIIVVVGAFQVTTSPRLAALHSARQPPLGAVKFDKVLYQTPRPTPHAQDTALLIITQSIFLPLLDVRHSNQVEWQVDY